MKCFDKSSRIEREREKKKSDRGQIKSEFSKENFSLEKFEYVCVANLIKTLDSVCKW